MYLKKAAPRKITNDTLILIMGLLYPTVHNYIWQVVVTVTRRFGLYFSNQLFDTFVWIFVAVVMIMKGGKPGIKINLKSLFALFTFVVVILLSYTIAPYEYFTSSVLSTLLWNVFFYFLLGSLVKLEKVSFDQLYVCSLVSLVVSMAYSVYSVFGKGMVLEDNMHFAYLVLPAIMIIVARLFSDQKKVIAGIFAGVGVVFLVLQGTRGPMLCLAVFICLMLYKKYGMGKFCIRVGIVVLVGSVLLGSTTTKTMLLRATEVIDSSGYSSRFLVKMIEGEISDANGRDIIQDVLIEDIKEEPFKVRGLFADREATRGLRDQEYFMYYRNGTHAHNIILELVYDWGIIIGGVLVILLIYIIIKALRLVDRKYLYVLSVYICVGFVQLFASSSYLRSEHFYFLLGLLMSVAAPKIKELVASKYDRVVQGKFLAKKERG